MSDVVVSDSNAIVRVDDNGSIRVIQAGIVTRGEPGISGGEGAAGAFLDAFEGDWSGAVSYTTGQIVSNPRPDGDGGCYVAINASTNKRPGTVDGSGFWAVVVQGGQEGPQGDPGENGSVTGGTVIQIKAVDRGGWNTGIAYVVGNLVRRDQDGKWTIWYCREDHTSNSSNAPEDDADKWRIFLQAQAGPQGPRGLQGDTGPAGPAGSNGADGADGEDGTDGSDGADAPVEVGFDFYQDGRLGHLFKHPCTIEEDIVSGTGTRGAIKVNGVNAGAFPFSVEDGDVVTVAVSGTDGNGFYVTLYGTWD
jgi:hypothetical protein